MFRRRNRLPITLSLALLATTITASPASGQEREMRASGSTELTTTVTLDEDRMTELAERSDGEKPTMFDAIRDAGSVSLSGESAELMLVMFHVDEGKVTGTARSEPFGMRGNTSMSLDEVMYEEERPAVMAGRGRQPRWDPAAALGGWHIALAGKQGIATQEAMERPEALLRSRGALTVPRDWQDMTGIVAMAVPTDRGALASATAMPAGLFAKRTLPGDP